MNYIYNVSAGPSKSRLKTAPTINNLSQTIFRRQSS